MKLEEVFLNDLAQSNLVDVDRPPMRIDITGVGQPTPPEEVGPAPDLSGAFAAIAGLPPSPTAEEDPTAFATQMAAGTEPEGATPMSLRQFATSAADVPAGLVKGAVQGSIGLPGDIISLARGLYDLGASGGDLDAFLAGLEKPTGLPTTEDMKKFFDETLGVPLIPEGAEQLRAGAAKTPEFVGELFGGGKTAVELAKGAARGINVGSMAVADRAVQAITGNPQATAMGALEAAGQMSPLARIVPGVQPQAAPQRSDIGFYSAVEKAVLDSKQEKGTGAQFLAQITKTQGVKPEELKWTGLDEFLKGKKSVTKAEIQDYLNANRVDVQEVRLGDYSKYGLEDMWEAASNRTKFSQYTLPGGENYREILLTLPSSRPSIKNMSRAEYNAAVEAADRAGVQDFLSTHFDQPNILAHMRVNDRVVDGKKTLFIEEIQSDWHQKGRKRGYSEPGKPFEVFDPRDGNVISRFATEREAKAYADQLGPQVDYARSEGVPDAPFKTSWHELTLKRAIQEASEKGYDQIAITTGKTQAERYALSKSVDDISWTSREKGGRIVVLSLKEEGAVQLIVDDSGVVTKAANLPNARGKNLDDLIGKDLSKKIMGESGGSLEGIELDVGGEGMEGFYDNILPKSLEKLGKKFDAKVGKTEMDGVEVWQMDITPKMRETVTKQGQPLFQIGVGGGAAAGAATMQDNEERM